MTTKKFTLDARRDIDEPTGHVESESCQLGGFLFTYYPHEETGRAFATIELAAPESDVSVFLKENGEIGVTVEQKDLWFTPEILVEKIKAAGQLHTLRNILQKGGDQ